jgi:glycine betaine/choline ABC-type transport system substrate-binding protein
MTDQAKQALNGLSAKITTEELTELNKLVDIDKQGPERVATDG